MIVQKRYDDDGELYEIIGKNFHIENMGDGMWYIGIGNFKLYVQASEMATGLDGQVWKKHNIQETEESE